MILGAAILLKQSGSLLCEVQKPKKWKKTPDSTRISIGIGCIGGSLENSESAEEALQREANEEMGCGFILDPADAAPFSVGPDGAVTEVPTHNVPANCHFLWEGSDPGFFGAQVAVFRGRPAGEPSPQDLPALIRVLPEILMASYPNGITFEQAIGQGAEIVENVTIPRHAHMTPVGTIRVLLELRRTRPDLTGRFLW